MSFAEIESSHKCVRQFKRLRKLKGMTQQDVADITGVTAQSISYYESGRRSPNLGNFIKIIHAVGGTDLDITGWE